MSVRIGELLLVEHYLELLGKLKWREDLTKQQKEELVWDAERYVDKWCGMNSEIERTFGTEHSKAFFSYLYDLCDEIDSARKFFKLREYL